MCFDCVFFSILKRTEIQKGVVEHKKTVHITDVNFQPNSTVKDEGKEPETIKLKLN